MTAAQLLIALSGLAAGTAAQHLQAITAGSGPGTTIFAPWITVCTEGQQTTLVQQPSKERLNEPLRRAALPLDNEAAGDVFVLTSSEAPVIFTQPECLYLVKALEVSMSVTEHEPLAFTVGDYETIDL